MVLARAPEPSKRKCGRTGWSIFVDRAVNTNGAAAGCSVDDSGQVDATPFHRKVPTAQKRTFTEDAMIPDRRRCKSKEHSTWELPLVFLLERLGVLYDHAISRWQTIR
jgi:hypothetical protein